jgi:hypothetical protein
MGDLSVIINYALKKAIGDYDEEMIQNCIDQGAVVNTDVLKLYFKTKPSHSSCPQFYCKLCESYCPVFEILISNVPSTTVIPRDLILLCATDNNPHYLETILTTQKYEPNSEVLLHILTSWAPQYVVDLLLKHGFGESELGSIIMGFISTFDSHGLSRLIEARVNLLSHQHAIFTFLSSLYERDPTFSEMRYPHYVAGTLILLINYLKTNPYSAMNYSMVRYLRDNKLLGISDIAECIWSHYLNITVEAYSDYINFYQSVIESLSKMTRY